MEREMNTIGEKISDLRRKKGLSQEELGDRVGVSRQTVMRWEAGTSHPNMSDIEHLCAIFNVPLNYFGKGKPEAEVVAENVEVQPVTEVVMGNSMESTVSEPISEKSGTETKRKPWKSLVMAIVFTILTFIPLFFCIITGVIAFSTNQGFDMVADRNFDLASFITSLCFAILCFIVAIVGWVRFILTKKR